METDTDTESLVDEDGDIIDSTAQEPPILLAKDPLHLTADECRLRLLHAEIKHRAIVPSDPSFKALPRANPPRLFQLRLPKSFRHTEPTPLDFLQLFLGDGIIDTLVQNTNAKASIEEAQTTLCGPGRRWKLVDREEISTWLGLTIYIGLCGNQNIQDLWDMDGQSYHRPMQCMLYYRYTQIKRYFYIAAPTNEDQAWSMKLSPLYEHLNSQFKAFYIPLQNVSVDEMMKAFTGRLAHTLKMPNKPVKEGYKM
jgi:hypothetical protein